MNSVFIFSLKLISVLLLLQFGCIVLPVPWKLVASDPTSRMAAPFPSSLFSVINCLFILLSLPGW
uniref:Uncharacterized protein n=1 Tax=Rhizophora mucronata TaxID=61149 RepID=A0A2P2N7M9_RHIMU